LAASPDAIGVSFRPLRSRQPWHVARAPGAIVALLGPNGAEKTVTPRVVVGTPTPTSGSIHHFDKPFAGIDPLTAVPEKVQGDTLAVSDMAHAVQAYDH
jgi:ABC-type lipopolysaccharide export system ATPase subunit